MPQLDLEARQDYAEIAENMQHFMSNHDRVKCPAGCKQMVDKGKLAEHIAFGCTATV